jgi:ankyrin repeat protein
VSCEYNYTPPLHFAVREGYLDVTRFLLDHGADPGSYQTYAFRDTLLTMARERNHDDVAELLLEYLSRRSTVVEGLEEFFKACRGGDLATLKSELERNPALASAASDTGDTALHQAVDGNQSEIVDLLLDHGANPDAQRADGVRPINVAIRRNNIPLAQKLLARGVPYNIYIAAVFGDTKYVQTALDTDSSLANFEDSSHVHPLTAATNRNDLEMVKLLLAHGANPSLPEEGAPLGQPLWTAVYRRQHEIAKLLLEHGANPNTAPESSGSALFQARGDEELTRLLIEHGAVDNSGDMREFQMLVGDNELSKVEEYLKRSPELLEDESAFWGEGILSGPANGNRRDMIELLMRYGARVPDVTKWGPYYYFKHYETAKLLLERGMNPNHLNWLEVSLLHYMAQQGDLQKAQLLLDHGADIDALDEEYRSTPLGFAARWGQKEIVALLLSRGADVNKSGAQWSTPLAWSRKKGHGEIESLLLASGAVA